MAENLALNYWREVRKNDPLRLQATANTVLWDSNTGDPFFLPPGGSVARYLAKGFRPNPPKGWQPSPDRPVAAPPEPVDTREWEPERKKTDLQLEYERKLQEMQDEAARKDALQKALIDQQSGLTQALTAIASKMDDKPAPKGKGKDAA